MIRKILFVTTLIVCQLYSFGQDSLKELTYFPPYDSISVAKHMDAINIGVGYLILTKAIFRDEEAYYLTCTAWHELPEAKRSRGNVDSLLNVSGPLESVSENLIPIPNALIDYYADKSKCELLKMIFHDDGYYDGGRFYVGDNLILAALLKKGVQIYWEDYDGNLFCNLKELGCVE